MFFRIVSDSFARKPRRKVLTAAALALGMAVATATLEVALDVGDRLAREFRSLGANLLVTPASDTLPLEIGGVDYRPVDAGAYLPDRRPRQIEDNFLAQQYRGICAVSGCSRGNQLGRTHGADTREELIGTWYSHTVDVPDGSKFVTGVSATDPWWHVDGRWFSDGSEEAVAGAGLAQRLGLHPGSTRDGRRRRSRAYTYDHRHCFDRRPRRQRDPRAAGSRAGSCGPPRPIPQPAGERAHQTRGCIFASAIPQR